MTNQSLTKSNGTGMAVWGERGDVRELEVRLREMLPGADRLTPSQRLALAQASLAHGLDPFNGELWLIPGRGLMIGVKGLRKKAHEQVKGNYWAEFVEITDADYRVRQRIPAGALAYECRLFDSENLRTYAETCERLLKAGIPWEAVREMVGSKPYTVGIGVLAAGEPTKMQPAQCAMKRAEADAIKRRFDVPFGLTVTPDQDAPENGEWIENAPSVAAEPEDGSREGDVPEPAEPDPTGTQTVTDATQPLNAGKTFSKPDSPQPPGWLDDAGKVIPSDYQPSSPIWLKWAELKQQAIALHVTAPVMDAAATDKDVASACNKLATELKAARKKGAASLYPEN